MKPPEALRSTAETPAAKTSASAAEKTADRSDDLTSNRSAETSAERKARERVAQLKSFYTHLAVFLVAHSMMIGLYLLSGGGHFWPLYSIFGWGIGLASHAASTFDMMGMYGRSWEERKVREIMLQQEHGLSADEVRTLLKREMNAERSVLPSADEVERMRRRLENLEAIVTSRDWDELPSHSAALRQETDADFTSKPEASPRRQWSESDDSREGEDNSDLRGESEFDDPAARAARLAKRVR